MNTQIAFLRAINVAGHAIVKMSDLREAFRTAGCRDVRTYIQSGNIIFTPPAADIAAVNRKLQAVLLELLGTEATILYRSAGEIEELVHRDPFRIVQTEADAKRYVAFLARPPAGRPKLPLCSSREGLEAFQMVNLDVFVVSRRMKGRFGFPNNFIEKELGVPATTRNWSTVRRIAELVAQRLDS